MKVLFCAYRDWALKAYDRIWHEMPDGVENSALVMKPEELLEDASLGWDIIVLIGWSWKVPADIVNSTFVIGMHPSDLPAYAGGSPIQNQILDGLTESKASLFRLTEKFDDGPILGKQPYSLEGSLQLVFESLIEATVTLVIDAINNHPHHDSQPQGEGGFVRRRLKPEHSKLTATFVDHAGKQLTARQAYDAMRCREDPYPNAYVEDETGRLLFKLVEFDPK